MTGLSIKALSGAVIKLGLRVLVEARPIMNGLLGRRARKRSRRASWPSDECRVTRKAGTMSAARRVERGGEEGTRNVRSAVMMIMCLGGW